MEPESTINVELPLKKRVIKIEVGETNHGRDQLVISFDQVAQTQSVLSREERVKKFKEEINKVRTSTPPKIQKVIFLLRDHKHFVKYYEPRVVSLGPIHHGKEKYRLAETFKLRLAHLFVNNSGRTIEDLCKAVDGKIQEFKECFEEEVKNKYTDDDLAWILFVDGCAILQYIDLAIKEKFKELDIKPDSVAFCQQDLFLLENQVPYDLLHLLMGLSSEGSELKKSVEKFIERNHYMVLMDKRQQRKGENSSAPVDPGNQPGNGERSKPTHLLDLLRSSLLMGPERQSENAQKDKATTQKVESNHDQTSQTVASNHIPPTTQMVASHDRPTTQSSNLSSCFKLCSKKSKNNPDWQSYRNVQELKAAGIHLKRSELNSLRSISFSKRLNFYPGYLWLPPLIVDDSTAPKFLNLIAYEMCLDFKNDFGITSYVSFLDSLIDEANDVKELRKAHVLFNLLGSDEEVAKVFNQIGTDLVPDLSEYRNVRTQIQKYYDQTWVTWVAEFLHNHFSSPWTILAFVGAILALAMTAAQTWYTVDSPPSPCDNFCDKFNQNLRKG